MRAGVEEEARAAIRSSHSVRQRVFQIACGYEDQNDSDTLREDPLLKALLRLFARERNGPRQPTDDLPPGERGHEKLVPPDSRGPLRALSERARERRRPQGECSWISTRPADPAHGDQEGSYYHGYYRQHMYHPLLVFDGQTGHLVTALLRAGNTHASNASVAVLQAHGLAFARKMAGCGHRDKSRCGLRRTRPLRLLRRGGRNLHHRPHHQPAPRSDGTGSARRGTRTPRGRSNQEAAPLGGSLPGRKLGARSAGSSTRRRRWSREPTRASSSPPGPTVRRTSTSSTPSEEKRENWIKDFKLHVKADRLSCHRFIANQFRLLLHAVAYWLLDTLRRKLVESGARGCSWTPCDFASSRSEGGSGSCGRRSVCTSHRAIPDRAYGTLSSTFGGVHE